MKRLAIFNSSIYSSTVTFGVSKNTSNIKTAEIYGHTLQLSPYNEETYAPHDFGIECDGKC